MAVYNGNRARTELGERLTRSHVQQHSNHDQQKYSSHGTICHHRLDVVNECISMIRRIIRFPISRNSSRPIGV